MQYSLEFEEEIINKKVKPIIKWTGGKYDEFSMFSKYIPPFNRYIEPFFGGGGVFFALQPSQPSLLNDKSVDLVQFYSLINSPAFEAELLQYADAWESAGRLSLEVIDKLADNFFSFMQGELDKESLDKLIYSLVAELSNAGFDPLFVEEFIISKKDFVKKLQHSVADKCRRIKALSVKEKGTFAFAELKDHIETGIKSGLFLYFRGLMNKAALGKLQISKEKASATWYFVREFCYASMFRFNAKNEFNIPYGGIAYNKKNFRQKVEKIFSGEVKRVFSNAKIFNKDFEQFLKEAAPAAGDFIFADPPYDSDFSEYDQNAFTKDDQVRLRNALINTHAKWMVVIKETAFIRDLYTCAPCNIIEFDKTYTYNVRGRNNRDTKHLIILNYDSALLS